MTRVNRILTLWLAFAFALVLSGCGFHMSGAPSLPFQSLYIDLPTNSSLYVELKRNIRAGGTTITTNLEEADAVLRVISNTRSRKILTINNAGRVRELSLLETFVFSVNGKDGKVFVPPTTIIIDRDMTYNEQNDLSKQSEAELIYQEMQSDIVQRVLRLIADSKNTISTHPTDQ